MAAEGELRPFNLAQSIKLNKADDCYLFHVIAGGSRVAATTSDHVIKCYDSTSLTFQGEYKGHQSTIMDACFVPSDDNLIFTCSVDKTALGWDLRQREPALAFQAASPLWSSSVNEDGSLLAAAGEDTNVYFWDVRQASELYLSEDAHYEPVTSVRFHTDSLTRLVTASEDGLLCLIDMEALEEDDGILAVLNEEQTITDVGFFGPSMEFMYCLTGIETLSVWTLESCDQVATYESAREDLSSDMAPVDFLVGCQYDALAERFYIVGGNHEGDVVLGHVSSDRMDPMYILRGPSDSACRSFYWNTEAHVMWTGSEDSQLTVWNEEGTRSGGALETGAFSKSRRAKDDDKDDETEEDVPRPPRAKHAAAKSAKSGSKGTRIAPY